MKKAITLVLLSIIMIGCIADPISLSPADTTNDSGGATNNSGDTENNTGTAEYLYYISGKINGVPFIHGQTVNTTAVDYSSSSYGNSITTGCAYEPVVGGLNYLLGVYPSFDNEARPQMDFNFVRFYLCSTSETALESFNDSFPIGSYDLATSGNSTTGSTGDIGISYKPVATGSEYYTTFDGIQNNSLFQITSSTNADIMMGTEVFQPRQLLEGTFAVTLYNPNDVTDVLEITEGNFKMHMAFD